MLFKQVRIKYFPLNGLGLGYLLISGIANKVRAWKVSFYSTDSHGRVNLNDYVIDYQHGLFVVAV